MKAALLRRALQLSRRAIPEPVRFGLRRWMFASLNLTWQTPSGVQLRIGQYVDWTIYNEIFVDGDYDQAIALALASAHRPLRIVDLGANVGFFTLRALDQFLAGGLGRESMLVTAIEADPKRAAAFESRVFEENGLRSQAQLIRGLAGRRRGQGRLVKDCWSATERTKHTAMPYLDLSSVFDSSDRIDLLKCDIEGTEGELIEAYPDLLAKTQVAVFEFHSRRCDVEHCRGLLRRYGFTHESTRRPDSEYPVCTFWR